MERINFEAGTQVSPAKVTIDNVDYEVTSAVWEGNTPLSPFVLNKMQANIENAIENKRLKLGGKSEQDETPSPDNIVTIRNVGDNIQLFDLKNFYTNISVVNCTKELLYNGIRLKFANGADAYVGDVVSNNSKLSENKRLACIKVKPNTKYVLKMSSAPKCYISFLNKDYIATENYKQLTSNIYKFTTNNSTCFIFLRLGYKDSTNNLTSYDFTDIKLEEGSIATPYTPYSYGSIDYKKENNTESVNIHIPLNKGQVIHKDDYIFNNKIHQKRKTLVLDGTEDWLLSNNYTNNSRFSLFLNDIKINAKVLSSHFQEGTAGTDKENIDVAGNNQRLMITIRNSIATTVAQLKEYLSEQYANGTPVIIEYELAEEIVTPLTKEQIEAYYELQKAKYVYNMPLTCLNEIEPTLIDTDKKLEESLLDVEKLLAILSLNS